MHVDRLAGQVVVITGASSGIGRQAAIEFARAGCSLVCAARRAKDLSDTVEMCERADAHAIAVPTDVTIEEDVERLARVALERFGRIDVWVNNAGTTLFAPLAEGRFEEHWRVIETNVLGAMLGARAAIPIFRRQGRGVLINMGSVLSKVGQPFVPSYSISKFALRGLSESLRTELADDPDVHVCTILPYAVDTPHFQAGGNELGRPARALPPMQSPEKVARAIVEMAAHPRRERMVPRIATLGLIARWVFPETTDRLLLHALRRFHFEPVREARSPGNLFEPVDERGAVHGDRPPRVGTLRFFAWLAGELVRVEADAFVRAVARAIPARTPSTPTRPA
jgi:NAD(P)-dependent dehydrogenase (short-subunit alcohol dehydrogenase family)